MYERASVLTSRKRVVVWLSQNCFSYLHILGANKLHNHCRCATHLSFSTYLGVPVSCTIIADVQHTLCFDHDLFADSCQGHTQHQISLNFRSQGTYREAKKKNNSENMSNIHNKLKTCISSKCRSLSTVIELIYTSSLSRSAVIRRNNYLFNVLTQLLFIHMLLFIDNYALKFVPKISLVSVSLGRVACNQPDYQIGLSVCLSVCLSVRPSVRQHFACKHDNSTNIRRIDPKLIPWMYLRSVLVKFEDG